jgi:hypothetical protein
MPYSVELGGIVGLHLIAAHFQRFDLVFYGLYFCCGILMTRLFLAGFGLYFLAGDTGECALRPPLALVFHLPAGALEPLLERAVNASTDPFA